MKSQRSGVGCVSSSVASSWQAGLLCVALLSVAGADLLATDLAPGGAIVISEIQYNPPSELGPDGDFEYVELHNRSADAVDLTGWRLMDRDDTRAFSFPAGTTVPAGGELVVAGNAEAQRALLGENVAIVGDLGLRLSNGGDTVRVVDAAGQLVDRVEYEDALPWPSEADGDGSSLERVSLTDDITDFTNLQASDPGGSPGAPNARRGEIPARHDVIFNEIMYHPVIDPDAESRQHCEAHEFLELHNRGAQMADLSGWRIDSGVEFTFPAGTTIAPGGFLVVFADREGYAELYGEAALLVGPFGRRLDDGGEALLLVDASGAPVDYVEYDDSPAWPVNSDGIRGSLELVDPMGDNDRAQSWRESDDNRGTPGATNSAAARFEVSGRGAPPQINEVRARARTDPEAEGIRSMDEVEITARVRDRDGVAEVMLDYQVVEPGDYFDKSDPRFEDEWTTVAMSYDPARLLYAAVLEPQPHRHLVRYRVLATDGAPQPASSRAPYPDDPEPNFAYFVYDGVPDYVASRHTGYGELGHRHTNLEKLPIYHMLMKQSDFDEMWYVERDARDNTYSWPLTVVHENRVYDHCGARLRGSPNSRYGPNKRSMKLRINKGNRFRGRFHYGPRYPTRRSRISLHAGGFLDALAHQFHYDSGGLTPRASMVQLRLISTEDEHDQYTGDFLGLWADIQSIDKSLLRDNDRSLAEASSLYKMKGYPNKKHADCDPSTEDFDQFYRDSIQSFDREWFEQNLNLDSYFAFRSAIELTNNHDMDSQKNIGYYFDSEEGLWEPIPWDVECAFHINPCSGEEPLATKVPRLFAAEYRSRYRYIWQVHFDLERMASMIDTWADLVAEVGQADQDRWAREPVLTCPGCPDGTFSASPYQAGVQWMKRFVEHQRPVSLRAATDEEAPLAPVNAFPVEGVTPSIPVRLATLPFVDDSGDHRATHWLVIEPGGDWAYPIWEATSETELLEIVVPEEVTEVGKEYLFRARHIDTTDRASYLSEPTRFVVGGGATRPEAPSGLRVERAGVRSVALAWTPAAPEAGVVGYRVLRAESSLEGLLIEDASYTDHGVPPGTHSYQVVAVGDTGLESDPSAEVAVEIADVGLGGWARPDGDWDYLYEARPGEDLFTNGAIEGQPAFLDGTWQRRSIYNNWDGSVPGDPDGAPGGVVVEEIADGAEVASVLSIEDPGDPEVPVPNNRRIFFRHGLQSNFLEDGATLIARLRVNPSPKDLPGAMGQKPDGDRGQIGLGHRPPEGDRGHFSFWLHEGQLRTQGDDHVEVPTTEFQAVWVVIERMGEGDDHRVRFFLNGSLAPAIDVVRSFSSRGTEAGFAQSYIEMGLTGRGTAGAIQVDYLGYKKGAHEPSGAAGAGQFVRGDVNADGRVNLADVVDLLDFLFRDGAAPACADAGDADDSGRLNLADVFRILNHVLFRGAAVAPPFPDCGVDVEEDSLTSCVGGPCS